ncbi:hypothetical protein ACFSKN_02030 [Mariniflexile gromovii]|uniref:Uncharacterized protein n=1 Tax=Mariniflexile gromovii TaxID=362523 RepID=A0ABS4BQN0_9FLAO|nr:hypothetical protein [Mariniflexile gromovii]MBP0902380.1 hypothetical protein [Mariniflexile gromovii]
MKQLKIEFSLSEYNEKHTIYLGDSNFIKHHSKTFLKKYLSTYKKVLLDNVRIINNYNAQIYCLYRNFYFDLSEIEVQNISSLFDNFNKQFNWMFDNLGGCQNSIIFSKINHCIYTNIDILQILKSHSHTNKNYSLKNQSESLLKMISDFQETYERNKKSLDLNRDYTKQNLKLISNTLKKASNE